jgi:hypothetical protein
MTPEQTVTAMEMVTSSLPQVDLEATVMGMATATGMATDTVTPSDRSWRSAKSWLGLRSVAPLNARGSHRCLYHRFGRAVRT